MDAVHSQLPMPTFGESLFPFRSNCHAEVVEAYAQDWVARFRLAEEPHVAARMRRTRIGVCMATLYPAGDARMLEAVGTTFAWSTAFDDTFAEVSASGKMTSGVIGAMAAALELAPADPEGDRFAAALADAIEQLRAVMLPEQVDRIVGAMRGILLAQLWEANVDPAVVSLDEYLAMRPHSTYATLMESFVEPTNSFHLSDSVRRRPTVRRVIDACNNLMGWVNDLGSFAWEDTRGGGRPLTLPTLVARDRHCSMADAFAVVAQMCDDEAAAAHRAVSVLAASDDPQLRRFARGTADLIGAIRWHITLPRYTDLTS